MKGTSSKRWILDYKPWSYLFSEFMGQKLSRRAVRILIAQRFHQIKQAGLHLSPHTPKLDSPEAVKPKKPIK